MYDFAALKARLRQLSAANAALKTGLRRLRAANATSRTQSLALRINSHGCASVATPWLRVTKLGQWRDYPAVAYARDAHWRRNRSQNNQNR